MKEIELEQASELRWSRGDEGDNGITNTNIKFK